MQGLSEIEVDICRKILACEEAEMKLQAELEEKEKRMKEMQEIGKVLSAEFRQQLNTATESELVATLKEMRKELQGMKLKVEELEAEFKKPQAKKRTVAEREREELEAFVLVDEDNRMARRKAIATRSKTTVRNSPARNKKKDDEKEKEKEVEEEQEEGKEKEVEAVEKELRNEARDYIKRIRAAKNEDARRKIVDEMFAHKGWHALFVEMDDELKAKLDTDASEEEAMASLLH